MVLKPLGIWGVAALALIDSALIPIPGGLDGVLAFYVKANHKLFLACRREAQGWLNTALRGR